jgi:hypothetical protein
MLLARSVLEGTFFFFFFFFFFSSSFFLGQTPIKIKRARGKKSMHKHEMRAINMPLHTVYAFLLVCLP